MGIVSYGGFYPLDIGGTSVFMYYLVKELEKLGNDIFLFLRLRSEKEKKQLESLIQPHLTRTTVIPIYAKYDLQFFLNFPNLLLKFRESLNQFRHVLKDLDVVFYNNPPIDLAFPCTVFTKFADIPQLYFLHHGIFVEMGDIVSRYGLPSASQFFFQSCFKSMLKSSIFTRILVPNNYARELALLAGVPEKKIQIIPVGVDIEKFHRAQPLQLEGKPKILYVGRLDKIKRVSLLIRAFSLISEWFPDAHLYIVGSGSEMKRLESLVRQYILQLKVTFTGKVPDKDLPRYHKSCDIFVCPSIIENHPITLLEAMAAKMPIVATNAGGIKTIIKNDYNGLLVSNGWKSFAKSVKILVEDRLLAERISKNAFEDIKTKYTYPTIATKFHSLCRSLLS